MVTELLQFNGLTKDLVKFYTGSLTGLLLVRSTALLLPWFAHVYLHVCTKEGRNKLCIYKERFCW